MPSTEDPTLSGGPERPVPYGGASRRRTFVASLSSGYVYILLSALTQVALVPILLDGLGKQDYGIWITLYALVQWIAMTITWVGPGLINRIGSHFARDESAEASRVVQTTAITYALCGVVVVLAAGLLSTFDRLEFLGGELTSESRLVVLVTGLWAALVVQAQVRINVLAAAQRMYLANTVQAIALLLSGIASAILVIAGMGLSAVAISYAAGGLIAYLWIRRASHGLVSVGSGLRRPDTSLLKDILKMSSPYALSGLGWILLSSDILLLAFLTDPERVAEYGVAYKLLEGLLQLIWRIADTTQPYVVELDAVGNRGRLRQLNEVTVFICVAVGGSAAAVLFFLGDPLLDLWVGEGRAVGQSVVRALAVYLFLQTFVHAELTYPYATARMSTISRLQLVEGVVKVVLVLVAFDAWGRMSIPLASIASVACLSLWFIPRFTMRHLDLPPGRTLMHLFVRSGPVIFSTAVVAWASDRLLDVESGLGFVGALGLVGVAFGAAGWAVWLRLKRTGSLGLLGRQG